MARPPNRNSKPLNNLPPKPPFVTRGGEKLRGALDAFGLSVHGKTCLDIGAAHGGFTDCLLQGGARSVWCVDVGYGLLDYKLRQDPRVHLLERTNIRFLEPAQLTERPDFVTVDASFISLGAIFPKISEVIRDGGEVVALVKPQFEGTRKEAPEGFVKDEPTRQAILERTSQMLEASGWRVLNRSDSKIAGRGGNQETFFHLIKK